MLQWDIIVTLVILVSVVIVLVGNLLRNDVAAVLVMLSLAISGVLSTNDALSGFSSNVVMIIACMFIVGKAITNTGIAQRVGEGIIKYGGTNEKRLLAIIMSAVASVGAFMSSTATAAIFTPIALNVAEKANLNHKRFLMPIASAALISGMMTLVATTANVIMNGALREQGLPGLSFFSFTPFGVTVLVISILFMAFIGQNMLAPKGSQAERKKEPCIDDLLRYHKIAKNEFLLRVPGHSDLVDRTVARLQLNTLHRVSLLAVQSGEYGKKTQITAASPELVFHAGDLLMVIGTQEHVNAFADAFSLHIVTASPVRRRNFFQVVGIAEVMLNPDSHLIGKTLRETQFQTLFQSMVLGIRRKGETITEGLADIPLTFGDVLLVCGAWKDILRLEQNRDQYLLLTLPQDHKEVIPLKNKQKTALIIMLCMILLMAFNILPPVLAILSATAAMVLTRCVSLNSIYNTVDWQTIVMIGGIMPLALALQKTGLISVATEWLVGLLTESGPLVIIACLFIVTAILGSLINSTAMAVLLAPMAVDAGIKLHIDPQACVMAVAIASSATFASPFASPVNLVVREAGGYVPKDYLKVGLPLLGISLVSTVFLCWLFYI